MSDTTSDDPLIAMTGERDSLARDLVFVCDQRDEAATRINDLEDCIRHMMVTDIVSSERHRKTMRSVTAPR